MKFTRPFKPLLAWLNEPSNEQYFEGARRWEVMVWMLLVTVLFSVMGYGGWLFFKALVHAALAN